MGIPLMKITIGMDPDLVEIGTFVLTWHGFLTFISVALAVLLTVRWARKDGIVADTTYSVAVWCIIGGIIGTRLFHVIDFWDEIYRHNPSQIVQVWQGGITIYGGVLGGFVGGAGYIIIRNHRRFLGFWNSVVRIGKLERAPLPSVGRLADIAAPAVLVAMALGRVGDIINGEHLAKLTSLPWGFVYSNPESFSYQRFGLAASHPAVVYELLWDVAVLVMILPLRNRIRPPGMLFALFLALYSIGKFFISFLRLDKEWAIGLTEAHFVSIVVLAITVPLLLFKAQLVRPPTSARAPTTRSGRRG